MEFHQANRWLETFGWVQEGLLVPLKSHLPDPSFIWLISKFCCVFWQCWWSCGGRARGKRWKWATEIFCCGQCNDDPRCGLSGSTVTIMSKPHFFFIIIIINYLFLVVSSLLRVDFLWLRWAGATLRWDAQASHHCAFSFCKALDKYVSFIGRWTPITVPPRKVHQTHISLGCSPATECVLHVLKDSVFWQHHRILPAEDVGLETSQQAAWTFLESCCSWDLFLPTSPLFPFAASFLLSHLKSLPPYVVPLAFQILSWHLFLRRSTLT